MQPLFPSFLFLGIDPISSRKAFVYVAVDRDLNLVALADGEMEDIVAFLAGQRFATAAVNAPASVNRGMVRGKMKQGTLTPRPARGVELRVAEYELRQRGIVVAGTPSRAESCSSWIQSGFDLYRRFEKHGFATYPQNNASHQVLETHPHACFCALTGGQPLPRASLEGRIQRQLILHERGLRIKDPMEFFEEVTRHKLLRGVLPMDFVYPPETLDALVAAYTAWVAGNRPNEITRLGEAEEGFLYLPVKELKAKY